MSGLNHEVSEHIRVELESQFKRLAEAILAEQAAKNVSAAAAAATVAVSTDEGKKKSRFRLLRAAL